ncbi:uncharacterized protein LOC143887567 [Tasmannia lanceolata]|uniref:uncharacterized protein LOC143887567 n=1 Tax=Tasmannia lanceolata TaxID=3420 RepID=UPI0040634CF8
MRGLIVVVLFSVSVCCCFYGFQACLEQERKALLQLKHSISYPYNASSFHFMDWVGEDCCQWNGVLCASSSSRVVNLDLTSARGDTLGTWYPNATLFAQFKELELLDLTWNDIGGWVMPHGFTQMKSLKILKLGLNMLNESSQSLSALCGLTKLRRLDLYYNNLGDESLPTCLLSTLSPLEELNLSGNNLRGNLSGLCGMKRLKALYLSNNYLNDQSHPSCLGNLSSMENLDLSGNNFTFSIGISTGLCKLKNLVSLSLQNSIKGNIHSCLCGLKRLTTLDLSKNYLEDQNLPSCLTNLSSLEILDLSENSLIFPFGNSTGICKLRNLLNLNLKNNSIEGIIHPCMKDMHYLQSIDLSYNHFTGMIPSFIFNNLTKIETFDISNNQFMGVFSFSMFANLSKLSEVRLSNNVQLEVETEYPHWFPTFQLTDLYIENSKLNQHSTHDIPSFISNQHYLSTLHLDHSSLKGFIPSWLLYNTTMLTTLSLRGNLFQGSIPKSTHSTSLVSFLDISENNLSGSLPTNIGTLLPYLSYFNLSKNILLGRIPLSMGEMADLDVLDLSNNHLSGEMPHQLTKNCTSLAYVSVSSNRLQGNFLPLDANLTQLEVLLVNHNNFTGTIPSSLLNSPYLMILDMRKNNLSGPIPSWLFSFSKLASLLLGNNFFQAHIPIQLCQLSNINTLDLSNNSLYGNIPSCLNNITSWKKKSPIQFHSIVLNTTFFDPRPKTSFTTKGVTYYYEGLPFNLMTGIDLSLNQLTGDIPFQIGDLGELRSLNLSNNLLTGHIPQSFQDLENLESLDLSHNKLVGRIPYELAHLYSLEVFLVAYNNLSGSIPYERQFFTFSENSYEGNPYLCGPPLKRNCSLDIPSQPPKDEGKTSGVLDNHVIFYSFVAMSYAMGFWGVVGFLIFNKNWRHKYFGVMDAYIELWIEKLSRFCHYLRNHCWM